MTSERPAVRSGPSDLHQWGLWLSGLFGSRYDGLTHFHVVEPGVLMRCGQPRVRDLEQIRVEHGLRTVICARGGTRHPLRGRWFGKQVRYCQQQGIRHEHMPFSDEAAPAARVFERFLEIVGEPASRPVLVHCEQGFHRTGVLCAAYRIRLGGWTYKQAIEEMSRLGFEIEHAKRRPLLTALARWAQA